jgi:DNA primase
VTVEKPPIEAVLYHYGATYVPVRSGWAGMLCPFHDDKTKSGSVNTDRGTFHCFTCDAAGDAYDLIQQQEGIEFRDAVEFGARVFGEGYTFVRDVPPPGRGVSRKPGAGGKPRKYVPPGRRG